MIRFITDTEEKKKISREILEALTEWFEVEESREAFIRESADQPFWAAYSEDVPVGFLCLKETGPETVELAVMGVLKDHHREGWGRRLFAAAKDHAAREGYSFIQVKTVRSGMYEDYDKTNEFYKSLGFKELEVIETVWDEANPCQIYVMGLKSAVETIAVRHSYRGRFSEEPVPEEDLKTIASAGIAAPSGCNKQTTDIIVVNDPDVLGKIKASIDPPVAQTAPAMIVVLSRKINAYRDRCFAIQDYSAAIENMLLAIVELGYQSCWYEGHITDEDRICDKIASILNVPEGYDVVCVLPVGKALEEFHAPSKKPFSERVKFNSFT
ncbi:GNAT family N-acetyltransferase [Butyrivibrio sp. AE2032]|uniref:GNAT family N-acetyltransferase n=1 Tax=Butyrivibrio sp. AE2032 TaxID=1458463 RepID=UPI00082C6EBE|nr:GNAT family N-acetyltransferase [Butyrivibrio sp. AE2032]